MQTLIPWRHQLLLHLNLTLRGHVLLPLHQLNLFLLLVVFSQNLVHLGGVQSLVLMQDLPHLWLWFFSQKSEVRGSRRSHNCFELVTGVFLTVVVPLRVSLVDAWKHLAIVPRGKSFVIVVDSLRAESLNGPIILHLHVIPNKLKIINLYLT